MTLVVVIFPKIVKTLHSCITALRRFPKVQLFCQRHYDAQDYKEEEGAGQEGKGVHLEEDVHPPCLEERTNV